MAAGDLIAIVAAFASAIAAFFSYRSSKAANTLALHALTKKAQSELFTAVLLELADLLRIEGSNALAQSDQDFLGKQERYVKIGKQLQRLKALSPSFKESIEDSARGRASAFLAAVSIESTPAHFETDQLEAIISVVQQAYQNELNER